MPAFLPALIRHDPCCAQIIPTRSGGLKAAMGRWLERCLDALRTSPRQPGRPERLPTLDLATLRDLGLSHAAAARTPRHADDTPFC